MRHHKVSLSPQYVQQCLEIIDELCKYKTASLYMNPVDPVRDNCPDYFDVIKNPMDFTTIRTKLTSKSYSSISEWKRDVYLIFSNSKLYNSKDSLYGMTAKFLQKKFNELIKYLSEDGWQRKLDFLEDQVKNLVENRPANLPNPYFSISEIESKRHQLFPNLQVFGKRTHKHRHHIHVQKKVHFQKDIDPPTPLRKMNKSKLHDTSKDFNKNKIKVARYSMLPKNYNTYNQREIKSILEPKKREDKPPPVKTIPIVNAPIENRPVITAPIENRPVITAPIETTPVITANIESRPVITAHIENRSVITAPIQNTPVKTTPVSNQDTIKKFHLYDQNVPFTINDHSNIFKSIGPNKVNKILSSRVVSHPVQSVANPVPANPINNEIRSVQKINYANLNSNSNQDSKKNNKKETNRASVNHSNQSTSYTNNYKNSRNNKSNNDSDSSDDIFVLDD